MWVQAEKLEKEMWILGLMDCLQGKLRETTYNLYVERNAKGNPVTYDELWAKLKNKGQRVPEDHYRDRIENFRTIKKMHLEEVQMACRD